MTLIEAAKQARNMLEHIDLQDADRDFLTTGECEELDRIIELINKAIAKAEQQPDHTEQHLEMVGKPEAERDSDCKESDGCPTEKSVLQRFWREAQQQEPVQQDGPINDGWQITVAHGHSGYGVYAHMEDYPEEGAVLVQAIEQPKPPAGTCTTTITTYASKREWQGLTLEQKHQLNDALNLQGRFPIIEAIEAKLKEKNT